MQVIHAAETKRLFKRLRKAVAMITVACTAVAVAWTKIAVRTKGLAERLRGVVLPLLPRRLSVSTSWTRMSQIQTARARQLVTMATTALRSCMELSCYALFDARREAMKGSKRDRLTTPLACRSRSCSGVCRAGRPGECETHWRPQFRVMFTIPPSRWWAHPKASM